MTIPTLLTNWVSTCLSKLRLSTDFQVFLLLGDGSTRSFYRVKLSDRSFILVSDPQWTQTQDYPAHQKFLAEKGIPVPAFLESDPKAGFLLMEDLGDELLQQRLLDAPEKKMQWLSRCSSLLAQLHSNTYPVPHSLPVASRSFDAQKYFDEFAYTLDHLNQQLLKLPSLEASSLECLRAFCSQIASLKPAVFSHRDYHCRNLLLKNDTLVMIDFQDARMGSPHYDLASLLYDAYVPITDKERKILIEAYRQNLLSSSLGKEVHWTDFEKDLKNVAFQRTVKAAGSFASFYTRFGKSTHLQYLLPALESARELQHSGHGVPGSVLDLEKWIAQAKRLTIK